MSENIVLERKSPERFLSAHSIDTLQPREAPGGGFMNGSEAAQTDAGRSHKSEFYSYYPYSFYIERPLFLMVGK